MNVFIWVRDFGVIVNRLFGRKYYKRGEIMQMHIQVDDRHVWLEKYAVNAPPVLYRVGFGARPSRSPLMSQDDARKALDRFTAGGTHV